MGRGDHKKVIDPSKDPEAYAKYLKDREEHLKRETREKKAQEEKEARLAKIKIAGTQEFKVGAQVVVVGLQKNPEKNGAIGTLTQYVKEKDRWAVEFATGSNNFKVENLQVLEDEKAEAAKEAEEEIPTAKIYVSNLSAEVTEQNLVGLFSGIGMLAREPIRNAKGKTKGYEDEWPWAVKLYKPGTDGGDGCIEFIDRCSARAAIKTYNGHVLKGKVISVDYATGGEAKVDTRTDRERSRSRERKEELKKLTAKLREANNPLLKGIFG
eukprot:gb/GFBE01050104.1/.p1 GENE.gb/GFBE01050104.1/~~gb/GFBE01050104.1/.p1  ORF type:complete len:268 (+),score=71.31 gb/GFBE01050104.1/:1-804(+)